MKFKIHSKYQPTGDQPQAIDAIVNSINNGNRETTLLGVTGSGKTFTMANVIERTQRPTLVLAHNKTLAAQLCSEFKEIFPENAVEYFVSYYDYYQPEAYVPQTDTYIEKDSSINDEIDKLRHSATLALSERRDVIIVASVSCIYSLGDPIDYRNMVISLRPGMEKSREELVKKLVELQYERNDINFIRNKFRVRGDVVEIFPASSNDSIIRVEFFGDEIDRISEINPLTGELKAILKHAAVYPASHYIVSRDKMQVALAEIERELDERLAFFRENGKLLEAQRIEQRTRYDMEMLQEIGFCSGIENYSRILSGRPPGSKPYTLLDYFPDDFLLFVDESHVTLPQVRGMYGGIRQRDARRLGAGKKSGRGGADHPTHRLARPRDLGASHRGTARRFGVRDQCPRRQKAARARDDAHQKNGGGPDQLPRNHGHPRALYAPRYRHGGAHGDRARSASRRI